MRWPATGLLAVVITAVFGISGCGQPAYSGSSPCPPGTTAYQEIDVALHLREVNRDQAYRLPLGEIVTAPGIGYCASGDGLEVLKQQSGVQAFRAVRVGAAQIARISSCTGEVCYQGFSVSITITEGCQALSRDEAVRRVVVPRTRPQGSSPPPVPAHLRASFVSASEYDQTFHAALGLRASEMVWAVWFPQSTPDNLWEVFAVDACTDWVSPFEAIEPAAVPPAGPQDAA